ncbi:hypothetical protein MRX96_003610 [Rhipicephalus microplus]
MMARLLKRRSRPSGADADGQAGDTKDGEKQPDFNAGYLKPFDYGFLREVVMRASNLGMPNSGRILADVYYHTSSGQKLRSRPEVAAFLAANPEVPLTVDHFTFVRTPIYRPPLELVRKAAPRGNAMPVPETAVALAEESKRTASVPCELGQHHASVDNTTGRRVARKRLCCCEEQCSGSKQLRSSENTQFQPSFWQDHALPAGETRLANKHFLKRHGLQKAATELLGEQLRHAAKVDNVQATSPKSSVEVWQPPLYPEPSAVTLVSSSSKRPVVVVRDFLKGGELSDLSLGEDKRTPPKEATLVTPHVRSDYWRNTAAWDIYKVLKARQNGSTPGNRDKSPVAVEVRLTDISTDRAVLDEDVAQASQAPPVQCLPSVVQSKQPAFIEASSMQREQTVEPCNLRCPKAIDETPQLLCTRCLCLFHPVCVGMTNSHPAAAKGRFICKACTKKPYKASGISGSTEQASIWENTTASSKNTSSKPEVTLLHISKENTAKTMPSKAIASSTAAPVNTQCLSFSTTSTVTSTVPSSLSDSPVGVKSTLALSSSSSISVPVFHVVSSGPRPSTSGTPLRHVAQCPRLPFLLPAPVPPMTSGNVKEMPALKVQSKGPQNLTVVPSVYYTIQVTQKPGSINGEELKSLVNQLVQKHPEELNKMGSGGNDCPSDTFTLIAGSKDCATSWLPYNRQGASNGKIACHGQCSSSKSLSHFHTSFDCNRGSYCRATSLKFCRSCPWRWWPNTSSTAHCGREKLASRSTKYRERNGHVNCGPAEASNATAGHHMCCHNNGAIFSTPMPRRSWCANNRATEACVQHF